MYIRTRFIIIIFITVIFTACSSRPLVPYTNESPPLVLMPVSQANIKDERGRFREIFCEVNEKRGDNLPDYRSCESALTYVGTEPVGTGHNIEPGTSRKNYVATIVLGIGADCFASWINANGSAAEHVRQYGYDMRYIEVESLSSSQRNAFIIRESLLQMQKSGSKENLILIGYSKGIVDILESIVSYPEIRGHVAAIISVAGAVGGSPLANNATQSQLEFMKAWPGAKCTSGDGGAMDSLRTDTRKTWLESNPLPDSIPYYSLVAFPDPERISSVLKPSYNTLSQIDGRNDGQVLFYDQVIPGSTLLGYINADHFAAVIPIARTHAIIGNTVVEHNDYPREVLLEALLRFVEEDLSRRNTAQ